MTCPRCKRVVVCTVVKSSTITIVSGSCCGINILSVR